MTMRIIFLLYLFFEFQNIDALNLTTKDYSKQQTYITMRDGVKLFTTIYSPKQKSEEYPIILTRTTYSCAPYGKDVMPQEIMYNPDLVAAGYIFVIQDVRGRWMSEGIFENTKPPYSLWDKNATDEITDTWDTFEWLKKNVDNFNGNFGVMGNSYLGWTSLIAGITNHPNLKAVLASAPVTDFYFEDFSRYGLIALNYTPVINAFGIEKKYPVSKAWYEVDQEPVTNQELNLTSDYYDYFLNKLTLKEISKNIDPENTLWNLIRDHQNYDEFRQQRNWLNYLNNIKVPMLIVGGWNDEQNLYGILNSYKTLVKNSPEAETRLFIGPWAHSHLKVRDHKYYLGDIFYGYDLSEYYHKEIQVKYFEYYLKGKGEKPDFKIRTFDTGLRKWIDYSNFPKNEIKKLTYFLDNNGKLTEDKNSKSGFVKYYSDPFHPVPFIEDDHFAWMAPKSYMTADQRYASKRPDVLTFVSQPLEDDTEVFGTPKAVIDFETDQTDADIYVKIIDVYPMDRIPYPEDKPGIKMNGYQQLVRLGYIRARYRNTFEEAEPLIANQRQKITVPLLDICHTFEIGHRIMIQIQSSDFPLFDINPQNYIEDIFKAERSDFSPAFHKVYNDSWVELPVRY